MEHALEIPRHVPVIVLSEAVLFPHSLLPLHIFEQRYRAMLEASLGGPRIFGVAQALEWDDPDLPVPDLAGVMGVGVIRACVGRPDGTSDLILQGLARVKIIGESQSEPFRIMETQLLTTQTGNQPWIARQVEKLLQLSRRLSRKGSQMPQQMVENLERINDPEVIGDLLAAAFLEDPPMRQQVLETSDLAARLTILSGVLDQIDANT